MNSSSRSQPGADASALAPSPEWVLERAKVWSGSKSTTSVKALAWNFLGMWKEWQAHATPTPQPEQLQGEEQ